MPPFAYSTPSIVGVVKRLQYHLDFMKIESPKIGIYAGSGTSHSWLWFVDLFEKASFFNLIFLDEISVRKNLIKTLDVLVISGGDTFAVAENIGEKGARNIETFVKQGGIYIGSCAGAYLPMKSSKKPLDLFNFVDVKITNLSKTLPIAEIKSCKFCTDYGCDFIFHPVREAVGLKTTSFYDKAKPSVFEAPLYGGPGMDALDPSWVLAKYHEFSPKTSFLTSQEIAQKTLISHGAVVRVPFDLGCFYLLGPHLEHPGFKHANQFIIDAVIRETTQETDPAGSKDLQPNEPGEKLTGKDAKQLLLSIRRELSNSRIVAGSLEFLPVQWVIGQKVYEPQKVRVYLEAMWKRLRLLEKNKELSLMAGQSDRIINTACRVTIELRRIKQQLDAKLDSLETAIIIFDLLHTMAISFFELYFTNLPNVTDKYKEKKKRKDRIAA